MKAGEDDESEKAFKSTACEKQIEDSMYKVSGERKMKPKKDNKRFLSFLWHEYLLIAFVKSVSRLLV